MGERPDYSSYILRIWRRGDRDGWFFHLTDINTVVIHTFTSQEELSAYIRGMINERELGCDHTGDQLEMRDQT